MTTATEYLILVDERDQPLGLAHKMLAHEQHLLHRAFSVFIFRPISSGKNLSLELLLQQRAKEKYHGGELWTNTCCSHPYLGENILAAGQRRLREELGFTLPLKSAGSFHYQAFFDNGLSENEIDHVLVGFASEELLIKPHQKEIQAYQWINLDTLQEQLKFSSKQFTPWLPCALNMAIKYVEKYSCL